MKIRIKYQSGVKPIEKLKVGDWIDLRAAETIRLNAGDFELIPLGVAMELPKGYEAHLIPRSSTFKKYGIKQPNSPGLIDESYCGDEDWWYMPALAHRDTIIEKNDRICQFKIVKKMEEVEFEEVLFLGNENRGGHGSTGVK